MSNVFIDVYENINKFNYLLEKKNKTNLYVDFKIKKDDLRFKDNALNLNFKNILTDSLAKKKNFSENIKFISINSLNNNYLFRSFDIDTACISNYFSSDELNTFIDLKNTKDIPIDFTSLCLSKDTAYLINKDDKLYYSKDLFNYIPLFPETIKGEVFKFLTTSENSKYVNSSDHVETVFVDNNGKVYDVILNNHTTGNKPQFYNVEEFENIVYANCSKGLYYSTDKINFKLITNSSNIEAENTSLGYIILNQTYLGKFIGNKNIFCKRGDNLNSYNLYYSYDIYEKNEKIYYYKIFTFNNSDYVFNRAGMFNIIDSIVYACSDDGVYFSKDSGKNWDLIKIPNARSITKNGSKIVITTNNGIFIN